MGVRESLLNTITSVADSDFVRIVTSAGASSKATVKNLFKGFESNLGAKSSLTTSDYVRVVGSDNESYKQSVSSVKTAMGIDTLNLKSSYVNSLSSLNNVINGITNGEPFVVGIYSTEIVSLLTDGGSAAGSAQLFGSRKNATTAQYTLWVYNANLVYTGNYNFSTSTATNIFKMPTRAEVDALNSKTNFELRSVSFSYSLAVGGNTNTNLKTLIDADLPSGKTFLGIAGTGSGHLGIVISNAYYSNSNYSLQLFNAGNIARTGNATVYYLCG